MGEKKAKQLLDYAFIRVIEVPTGNLSACDLYDALLEAARRTGESLSPRFMGNLINAIDYLHRSEKQEIKKQMKQLIETDTNKNLNRRIYVAGPMRGYPGFNFPAFDRAKQLFGNLDNVEVITPADIDRAYGLGSLEESPDGRWPEIPKHVLRDIIRRDIESILVCDAIYMLEGWENSKGATAEKAVAEWLELEIMYETRRDTDKILPKEKDEQTIAGVELETEMAAKAAELSIENIKVFDEKQKAYGSDNISKFGERGVLVRVSDKFERLKNLLEKGGDDPSTTESILDSWLDLANYGLIGALCRKGEWK